VNPTGYAFLGLTGIVAALVAILAFAVLRFAAAARRTRRSLSDTRAETVVLASALEEAIQKLKAQQRATTARAEASERLNSAIIVSLTSGLLVVDSHGTVQTVNPAARQILGVDPLADLAGFRSQVPALADLIESSRSKNSSGSRRRLPAMASSPPV
jgi:nitrogen fixation/metabolism regulation signal transduction histidine kinase